MKLMMPVAVLVLFLTTSFANSRPLAIEATKNRVKVSFQGFEGSADQVSIDADTGTLTLYNVEATAKTDNRVTLLTARTLVYSLGGTHLVLTGVRTKWDDCTATEDELRLLIRK